MLVRASRVALVLALLMAGSVLAGCQSRFGNLRLTIAAGNTDGVYYPIARKLSGIWADQMDIPVPRVLHTAGSTQNIGLLDDGSADIAFSSADAVPATGAEKLRALARIYDDYIQVVVRADAPITSLAGLAGHRVSIGEPDSQVTLVAQRILQVAGVHGMTSVRLGVNDSISALRAGRIDAFFWSGGLATGSITALSKTTPIRLLDLSGVAQAMHDKYPVYDTAVVPAGTYGLHRQVTTITVPNFLLVTDRMPDDVAQALVSGLFSATDVLAGVNPHAALGIDIHNAIFTGPVPLHPGAVTYYRNAKI